MAQLVLPEITIGGKSVTQFRSLRLNQEIYAHHHFELVCPLEAIDDKRGTVFNQSGHLIGDVIKIRLMPAVSEQSLVFAGIVTDVATARYDGYAGDIIISGFSPTILMDSGPDCRSWNQKTLKTIMADVLSSYPKNLLRPRVKPGHFSALPYTVQYKESAWEFVKRISADYGEWLYYNGLQLMIGRPEKKFIQLIYGINLSRFSMRMQARPVQFKAITYDYLQHERYRGKSQPAAVGLTGWHEHVFKKSTDLYASKPTLWINQQVVDKNQLDGMIKLRTAFQSSRLLQATGSSDVPALQPGTGIQVEGRNIYSNNEELYGQFIVTAVQHVCDGQGQYSNDFTAIPAAVKTPPVEALAIPRCEAQSALVIENYDKKGLGRVRVKFHWMTEAEESPWLRVTTPHAGSGKGLYLLPEIGEEVMVAFEGDHPSKPYVIGSMYNGKAPCDFATENNDIKTFQFRNGKIRFNDSEGSILVEDKGGNSLLLNGAGSILVDAKQELIFRCGKTQVQLKEDGSILLDGQLINITADNTVAVKGSLITLN